MLPNPWRPLLGADKAGQSGALGPRTARQQLTMDLHGHELRWHHPRHGGYRADPPSVFSGGGGDAGGSTGRLRPPSSVLRKLSSRRAC